MAMMLIIFLNKSATQHILFLRLIYLLILFENNRASERWGEKTENFQNFHLLASVQMPGSNSRAAPGGKPRTNKSNLGSHVSAKGSMQ